jgi:hypothetical protein
MQAWQTLLLTLKTAAKVATSQGFLARVIHQVDAVS